MNQCSLQLAYERFARRVTREKATCEAHDWKLKSRTRQSSLPVSHEKGHLMTYSQNILFDKKIKCFTKFFIYTKNILNTHEL